MSVALEGGIIARHPGRCCRCRGKIKPGGEIYADGFDGWAHWFCMEDELEEPAEPEFNEGVTRREEDPYGR